MYTSRKSIILRLEAKTITDLAELRFREHRNDSLVVDRAVQAYALLHRLNDAGATFIVVHPGGSIEHLQFLRLSEQAT